ncbi:MAG TPA: chemotaxis protein CheW [Candidatus Paceibacterota bacterium]
MNSAVTFSINDQTMGVDMLNVDRIIKLSKISPIPNSPEYLEGVMDVQNMLIPIINLKEKFKFSSKVVLSDSNIIVISNQNKKCGIIVDLVNDIIDVNNLDISETSNNNYVYGVVIINNVVINLLNCNSLILDCIL